MVERVNARFTKPGMTKSEQIELCYALLEGRSAWGCNSLDTQSYWD
jgi:hypothetical protein